ncbi:MAG: two-component sensor histidine kinase [Mogibacterium sp.]|nr:two-component sensor histidine kinase [Mogibacterium sp.]
MIGKLKKRFIALAMTSLVVLLTFIVAGMNIINYNAVVRNADETLDMLSDNRGRMPSFLDDIESDFDEMMKHFRGPRNMSRDQAAETRFFSVLLDSNGNAVFADVARISAVDEEEAAEYAVEAIEKEKSKGFIDNYRYDVRSEGLNTRVTFVDCTRMLWSFKRFLLASIAMSAAGLAVIFVVICYFSGRIVKPVAESYEKQKRFITDAGHEIKTPLAIIKANIDVMRMDMDDLREEAGQAQMIEGAVNPGQEDAGPIGAAVDSLSESLSDIDGQVDRLTSLTNDLVYLSRMEEGGSALTMTEVPYSDIVSDTAESFRALAIERKKELEINVEPMLTVNGSTKELEKLVSILTENALKYSPEGDTACISLRREGKNAVLEVRNRTAEAISEEDLAHVFERFYRTDKSRNSAAGGHGIGLSMAAAIVAAHNGTIAAAGGDGSEFIVTAAMPAR